jgi:hypothetical protein
MHSQGQDATRPLRKELGGELPEGLAALDGEELRDLADALRDARKRQSEALADATREVLGYVPRLLRGPVRKVLGV